MTIKTYVVCGPGRCGGHLLMGLILATGAKAVRTHNMEYTTGDDATTAWIKVDRVDIFDAVCSNVIANRTGQTTNYDRKEIRPFYVGQSEFQRLYQNHLDHRENYQSARNFARTDLFWYEDFAQNWNVVWRRLEITPDPKLLEDPEIQRVINVPSPYNYRNIISNYQELRQFVVY